MRNNDIFAGGLAFIAILGLIYLMTGMVKKLSYDWWYEDKVRETVEEILEERGIK